MCRHVQLWHSGRTKRPNVSRVAAASSSRVARRDRAGILDFCCQVPVCFTDWIAHFLFHGSYQGSSSICSSKHLSPSLSGLSMLFSLQARLHSSVCACV